MGQLEALKVGKPKETHEISGDSEDEQDSTPNPASEKPKLIIPPGNTPHERVSAILRAAKNRRLAAEFQSTTSKKAEQEEVPDFAPRLYQHLRAELTTWARSHKS